MIAKIFNWRKGVSYHTVVLVYRILVGASLFAVHGMGKLSHAKVDRNPFLILWDGDQLYLSTSHALQRCSVLFSSS